MEERGEEREIEPVGHLREWDSKTKSFVMCAIWDKDLHDFVWWNKTTYKWEQRF